MMPTPLVELSTLAVWPIPQRRSSTASAYGYQHPARNLTSALCVPSAPPNPIIQTGFLCFQRTQESGKKEPRSALLKAKKAIIPNPFKDLRFYNAENQNPGKSCV